MEKNSDEYETNDILDQEHNDNGGDEVPDTVHHFIKIIESWIAKYDDRNLSSGNTRAKIGKMTEDDSFFYEAVARVSKFVVPTRDQNDNIARNKHSTDDVVQSSPSSSSSSADMVLQRAMTFMEEELRILLEDFGNNHESGARGERDDPYEPYPPEVVTRMNRMATIMISGRYETECCQVYSICRRNTFAKELKKLGFKKNHNSSDIEKMDSDSLEDEITKWLRATKSCSQVLFIGERRLGEAVFSDHPMISRSLFNNLARAVVIQLLDFADVVAQTKCSPEHLFKFLEMYETARDLIPAIRDGCSDESEHEITSEILAAGDRIGEASVKIFSDFDASIKNDTARDQVPGGAVHPLTRYVMNYLINACDFKPALEQIFRKHANSDGGEISPFSAQLRNTMELLDANLEAKSNLYKDTSLRLIFHMNNGRYILQKIKGSPEIREAIGDAVYRRRSTDVRQYHKNYHRETWGKVLQILKHDGLVQNGGKVNKEALKERFKNFSNAMEEIHKTQSSWVVNDEQLQSELRVSVSGVIIPAYRSFLGKFKHHLDGSKHVDRYIKYQSEDIETLIEGLFDGNPASMIKNSKKN
ncbi:hypothetical protein DM860_013711 [Cuscuta australis]|uniref:Exocyst subunit Exo70 family protein n=1 Tax=Cuscuta australis TaxID=267555 RepID=A0A328EAA3_9ASTE|nr:hypothetical protein DM860_013711 [Cuscuta australis]